MSAKKIEELSNLEFIDEKNEILKSLVISYLIEGNDKDTINLMINKEGYKNTVDEINKNSNIQLITKNKTNQEITDLLDDLINDHKEQSNLKKIESLEQKLINNLDENSYSELIKLKSQLNRE